MNPYQNLVSDLARCVREAKAYPLGQCRGLPRKPVAGRRAQSAHLSPHPDDEVIIGGLALRFLTESG